MKNRKVTFKTLSGKTMYGTVIKEDEYVVHVETSTTNPFTGQPWRLVAHVQRDDPSLVEANA